MNILGISCFYHDAAAVLLSDGQLIAAAEEERFSRKKHDSAFPQKAVAFCLDRGGLLAKDLDYVVFYEKPFLKFHRLLATLAGEAPRTMRVFRDSMVAWLGEKLWIKPLIQERLGVEGRKILFCEHHLSHAASAFFCSPFKEAAVLTVDGVGEWSTATLGRATARWDDFGVNGIDLFSEIRFPHSLGLLYSTFTAFLGFEVNEGEYKVMGMAPYGRPLYVDRVYRLLRTGTDGSFELDLSYFSFQHHRVQTYSNRFLDLFGPPRDPRVRFVTSQTSLYDDPLPPTREEMDRNQYYADVAASVQHVTEDIVLAMARHLHKTTGMDCLCLAGGVALNSVANGRLMRETPFREFYVQPAAGDAGGALGAALYLHHAVLGHPRRFIMDRADWGTEVKPGEAVDFLRDQGVAFTILEREDSLVSRTVDLLSSGKVIGWVQGRFEWGPRALGHRSILADPRRGDMKDIVNIKIKFREPFRPFAPSVLEEKTADIFDISNPHGHLPARFMLMVAPVRPDHRSVIPAVTHVDGSARLQTVSVDTNTLYHQLLSVWGQAVGVPVLLNTSFNLRGEPIVTSVADAFRSFQNSDMDALVLGQVMVVK